MADVCDDDGVSGESLKKKEFARTPSCFLGGKISAIRSAPADVHRSIIYTKKQRQRTKDSLLLLTPQDATETAIWAARFRR